MVNVNYAIGGAGVAGGGTWSNVGGTTTIPAGGLPGQLLPPVFAFEYSHERVTTEQIGNNAVRGVVSLPKKAHVKITTDKTVQPEVLAIWQGSTLTQSGTTPNRTYVLGLVSGTLAPVVAVEWSAPDLGLAAADIHWGFYNGVMVKDYTMKGEALKPDTKLDFEFDVFPDNTTSKFVLQAGHETAVAIDVTGQPKLP